MNRRSGQQCGAGSSSSLMMGMLCDVSYGNSNDCCNLV
jgi:hypothetical protein